MTAANKNGRSLFCFGLGYSARHLIGQLDRNHWKIAGTVREPQSQSHWGAAGIDVYSFDGTQQTSGIEAALSETTHVLVSAPPGADGDPVLAQYRTALGAIPSIRWIGYLSTVGVYGEHNGGWVDETTPTSPVSARSELRRAAEQEWISLANKTGKRVVIFRLAGIYGPHRSAIDAIREGRARRIIKPGQRFNRIHVADVANAVLASMNGNGTAPILNITDDLPAPPQDVIVYAAQLLGLSPPPEVPFEHAKLSPMARSFYGENKQVRNDLMKRDLALTLIYPTYREGLTDIAKRE